MHVAQRHTNAMSINNTSVIKFSYNLAVHRYRIFSRYRNHLALAVALMSVIGITDQSSDVEAWTIRSSRGTPPFNGSNGSEGLFGWRVAWEVSLHAVLRNASGNVLITREFSASPSACVFLLAGCNHIL